MATGSAWATHSMGLSPALGAFIAGVLLAVSPFATQIRADTRPLTTLMVTLFFAAIGMFGDPLWVIDHWAMVVGIVLAIIVGKPLIIVLIARAFGRPWRYAIAVGLCLAQVGEFSFVLATIAHSGVAGEALMSPVTFRAMVSATIVTLLFTPYFVAAAPRAGARFERVLLRWRSRKEAILPDELTTSSVEPEEGPGERSGLILIAGFGPAGQRVAEGLMDSHQSQMVAIDLNADNVEIARRYNLVAHLGDATHRDILEHAGIHQARVFVITMPDHATTRQLIHLVRDIAPDVFIVTRCRYHVLHWELLHAGAHEVVDEEDQLGRRLAAQVRQLVGRADDAAD